MKVRESAPLLSDLAYQRLLEALFDARVPMGSRVSQTTLTQITGMPVGPVRDALKVLEADGLVIVHARSGIELIKPSFDLVRATFQFRTIIEKPAARAFALSAPTGTIDRLKKLHDDLSESFAATDPGENVAGRLGVIEDALHLAIVGALGNELVNASYRRLQLMARVVKINGAVFPRTGEVTLQEHRDILEASRRRDADEAEAALSRHLTNALQRNLGVA
jgi:DNA-binding GntR family transcriptional regulator